MARDCRAEFYKVLDTFNYSQKKPQWDDVTNLIGRWQKALDNIGVSRWDQVDISAVRQVDSALTSSEKKVGALRTGLDAILEKHITQEVKEQQRKFIASYRNESAVISVLASAREVAAQNVDAPKALDLVKALRDLLTRPADNTKIGLTLEEAQNGVFAEYFNNLIVGRIYDAIPEAKVSRLFNDGQFVDDLIIELHRNQTDFNHKKYLTANKEAQIVSDIINDALGQMNLRLNQLGRKIPYSSKSLMPSFNWQRIKGWIAERGDNGETEFISFFSDRLDNAIDPMERQEIAQQVYNSLKDTQGYIDWDTVVENVNANGKNSNITERIKFKDGASWNELNNAFGERDFMGTIVGQIKYASKQIAIAQMLGPDWMRNWQEIQKRIRESQAGNERVFQTREWRKVQNTFDRLTASPKVPDGLRIQSVLSTGRSLEVASKLGSAMLTAIMDVPVMINVVTRLYGNSFMRNIDSVVSGFTDQQTRQYAQRLNIGVDGMMGALQDRFMMFDDWHSMNVVQRKVSNASNFVMKISGMELWTDMMRSGVTALFRKEIGGLLDASRTWDQLDVRFKASLERFKITQQNWETLTKQMNDERGRFDVFAIQDRTLREGFSAWFKDAVETAIISPSLRDVEHAAWMTQAGTNTEAVIKTLSQFKQFPLTFTRKVLGRAVYDDTQTKFQKVATIAQLTAMGTLMGAVVVQSQQMAAGKQPYALDSIDLWTRAFVLASPFGLLTDVFMESGGENLSRLLLGEKPEMKNALKSVIGPLFMDMYTASSLVAESIGVGGAALLGEFGIVEPKYNTEAELMKRMSKLTQWSLRQVPGQNLWQTKALYKMLFADALQEYMDPDAYRKAQARLNKDREQRIGNEAFNPYGQFIMDTRNSLIQ